MIKNKNGKIELTAEEYATYEAANTRIKQLESKKDLTNDEKDELEKLKKEVITTKGELDAANETVVKFNETLKNIDLDNANGMSEAEKQHIYDKITKDAALINDTLNSLNTQEEKDLYLKEYLANNLNMSVDDFKGLYAQIEAGTRPLSDIIPQAMVFLQEQELKTMNAKYNLYDLVPEVTRKNGLIEKFYIDYTGTDVKRGEDNVSIDDYNNGYGKMTQETFGTDVRIHKGFDIMDSIQNDIVKDSSMFAALLQNLGFFVWRPILRKKYEIKLQMLMTKAAKYNEAKLVYGTDVKPNVVIESDSIADTTKQILTLLGQLQTTSRNHNEITSGLDAYLPANFTTYPEYTMDKPQLIAPLPYQAMSRIDLNANTFQLGELLLPVSGIKFVDFTKVFEEYGKIEGIPNTPDNYILILHEPGAVEMNYHYEATKVSDTTRLKSVTNTYTKVGGAINKNKRTIIVEVKKPAAK